MALRAIYFQAILLRDQLYSLSVRPLDKCKDRPTNRQCHRSILACSLYSSLYPWSLWPAGTSVVIALLTDNRHKYVYSLLLLRWETCFIIAKNSHLFLCLSKNTLKSDTGTRGTIHLLTALCSGSLSSVLGQRLLHPRGGCRPPGHPPLHDQLRGTGFLTTL